MYYNPTLLCIIIVKQERVDEITTSTHKSQLQQKVKELEMKLSTLEEQSDSTIKLLKERLKEKYQSSESPPSTIAVKTEPPDDTEMETGDAGVILPINIGEL